MKKVLILPGTMTGAVLLTTSLVAGQASDPIIYDNGPSAGGGTSSQLDTLYPFDSQVADDFILAADSTITGMTWVGVFWNGSPIVIPAWNVLIYNDAGGVPTGGPGDPTPTAILNSQEGIVNRVDNGDGTFTWSTDLSQTIRLDGNTTYWAAVQSEFFFPPQWGWSASANQTGNTAKFGFPLLGTNYWAELPTPGDVAFQLHGTENMGPAPGALALLGLAALGARRRRRT
jgi:MYXO-CTERM domain-containing protein